MSDYKISMFWNDPGIWDDIVFFKEWPFEEVNNDSSWAKKRKYVWWRDHGYCVVCDFPLSPEMYNLGHKIDRCADGSDDLENVECMCSFCNSMKPVHESIDVYNEWKNTGGHYGMIKRMIVEAKEEPEEDGRGTDELIKQGEFETFDTMKEFLVTLDVED